MSLKTRAADRAKRMTLIEILLILLLLCGYGIFDRLGDVQQQLVHVDDSIVDLHNKVASESSDIQTKLDEQKDLLEQVEANQP